MRVGGIKRFLTGDFKKINLSAMSSRVQSERHLISTRHPQFHGIEMRLPLGCDVTWWWIDVHKAPSDDDQECGKVVRSVAVCGMCRRALWPDGDVPVFA